MKEQFLLPPSETRAQKFWKPWKWIGLIVYAIALVFGQSLPGTFVAAASIYGLIVLAHLIFSGVRYLKDRFFWRVRNRLIGSFIFVGVIPLLLILGVVFLTAYILFGQLAGQYVNNAIQENERLVSDINAELAGHLAAPDPAGAFQAKAVSVFTGHAAQFPRMAARLVRRLPSGTLSVVSKYDPHAILRDLSPHPGDKWRGDAASFGGILEDGSKIVIASFRPIPAAAGFYVETAAPLDRSLEERLRREKSLYVIFAQNKDADITADKDGYRITIRNDKSSSSASKEAETRIRQELEEQNAYRKNDPRRMIWWVLPLGCKVYESGKGGIASLVSFHAPWSVVFNAYMGLNDDQSRTLFRVVYILAGMFAFAELVSLIIGIRISRHITRSMHDVHQGILALQKGDLQHRIPVRRKDQLGLLAHSFNQMSGSIAHLLEEVVEKKRLEQELQIAREVQATLFPKQLPHPRGMSIFGGCKPARIVSGDYYDFIVEDETHLNIVVGDISGKGISAALLMASLQAAMRSQLHSSKHEDPETIGQNLAHVMAQLNQQIYLSSPPEKYATLFLSRYDADSRRLWYCNAGHLPPIVLSAQGVQTLDATGTVVGLFPDISYEAKSIVLTPGAVLAVFTDGITEALNRADEEFGDGQLLEALQQSYKRTPEVIWEQVMSKVGEWQNDLPQYDDITLIVAKAG